MGDGAYLRVSNTVQRLFRLARRADPESKPEADDPLERPQDDSPLEVHLTMTNIGPSSLGPIIVQQERWSARAAIPIRSVTRSDA